jgi:Na+/H+-dicarboxylate symporter
MPSLSAQVFIALGLGLVAGVFFGEMMTVLEPLGNVFIALLQMAVWPYIVFSLAGGLGGLSSAQAISLGRSAGTLLILFWGIALLSVVALVLTFPSWTSAAFFTVSLAETDSPMDFVSLYIPSNPFASMADSVLPAVVLFAVAVGIALISLEEKKKPVLEVLDALTEAMMAIASAVVRLAPIGVFALVGVAAGTMYVEELVRLQVYIYSYIAIVLLLCLWVVPGLVCVLMPISYRDFMRFSREALITAFATGSLLVALPLIAESAKRAFTEIGDSVGSAGSAVDVVVPVNFTLPNLGKLVALAFVPFAGWLTGFEMSADQYPVLLTSGLFSMFAEVIALPFLLDLMRIPADTFQLFVALDVSTGRFGQLLGGVHTFALALLVGGATCGLLQLNWPALSRYLLITVVLSTSLVAGLRFTYEYGLPQEYEQDDRFRSMELAATPVKFRVLDAPPANTVESGGTSLEKVISRGVLRVGYLEDSLPNVFTNSDGDLVGLDVDLANVLARDMGVDLELIKLTPEEVIEVLNDGRCDLVMSGLTITPERMQSVSFSAPYMKATLSFVVRDHKRAEYASREAIKSLVNPRIAVLDVQYYLDTLRTYLPNAEIVRLQSPAEFFDIGGEGFDAMLLSAERGSAWTLLHPEFSVAIPQPDVLAVPVAIGMPYKAEKLSDYVDAWLQLKREDRTLELLYRHWILGGAAEPQQPRWSVIRNVLGWIE